MARGDDSHADGDQDDDPEEEESRREIPDPGHQQGPALMPRGERPGSS